MKTIKYKKLLSWLINSNAISATVAWIVFLLLSRGGTTLFEIAWTMALFYGGFAILTFIQYKHLSKRIDEGKNKESDFRLRWERRKLNEELSKENQSEESDNLES